MVSLTYSSASYIAAWGSSEFRRWHGSFAAAAAAVHGKTSDKDFWKEIMVTFVPLSSRRMKEIVLLIAKPASLVDGEKPIISPSITLWLTPRGNSSNILCTVLD